MFVKTPDGHLLNKDHITYVEMMDDCILDIELSTGRQCTVVFEDTNKRILWMMKLYQPLGNNLND